MMIPPSLSTDVHSRMTQPIISNDVIPNGIVPNEIALATTFVPTPVVQTVVPANSSQLSSILDSIPRSITISIGIIGLIGTIGYISYKYCPWLNERLSRRNRVKEESSQTEKSE